MLEAAEVVNLHPQNSYYYTHTVTITTIILIVFTFIIRTITLVIIVSVHLRHAYRHYDDHHNHDAPLHLIIPVQTPYSAL